MHGGRCGLSDLRPPNPQLLGTTPATGPLWQSYASTVRHARTSRSSADSAPCARTSLSPAGLLSIGAIRDLKIESQPSQGACDQSKYLVRYPRCENTHVQNGLLCASPRFLGAAPPCKHLPSPSSIQLWCHHERSGCKQLATCHSSVEASWVHPGM
jgi:hypothetical protein